MPNALAPSRPLPGGRAALLLAVSLSIPSLLLGHFHMLLPESPTAGTGDTVRVTYLKGHPFEHEIIEVERPSVVKAHPPTGEPHTLAPCPGKPGPSKAKPAGHTYCYEVPRRGDHIITATTRPVLDKGHGVLVENHLKVILHSRTQNGWDRAVGQKLEIVPLIRPYGLKPGWVFQARVLLDGSPREGVEIEVEKYNESPPSRLPEDEFITRTSRTAPGGVLTTTLDEPGWWLLHASVSSGTRRDAQGTEYPLVVSATLSVYVGSPLSSSR